MKGRVDERQTEREGDARERQSADGEDQRRNINKEKYSARQMRRKQAKLNFLI